MEAGKPGLLRVVRTPDGTLAPDTTGGAPGRGAYLHLTAECLALARKRRSLERALKAPLPEGFWEHPALSLA